MVLVYILDLIKFFYYNLGMILNSKLTEELGAAKREIEILKQRLLSLEVGYKS